MRLSSYTYGMRALYRAAPGGGREKLRGLSPGAGRSAEPEVAARPTAARVPGTFGGGGCRGRAELWVLLSLTAPQREQLSPCRR